MGRSETIAEEQGMAQYIRENRERLRMEAALKVAEIIRVEVMGHGLGNFKQQEGDLEILARHLAAAAQEWSETRWWNLLEAYKPKQWTPEDEE